MALWRAVPAEDDCRPAAVTLRVPGLRIGSAELVDALYGTRQRAAVRQERGAAVLSGLLVGDWPLFVRTADEGP